MTNHVDIDALVANNRAINAKKLKERIEASLKRRGDQKRRYKYNIISPFSGKLRASR